MNKTLQFIKKLVIHNKIYITRTLAYIAIINSTMILFLFLSKLKEVGFISFAIDDYFFYILGIGVALLVLLGWIEIKVFGGFQDESTVNFYRMPPFVEMKERIEEIHKYLFDGKTLPLPNKISQPSTKNHLNT